MRIHYIKKHLWKNNYNQEGLTKAQEMELKDKIEKLEKQEGYKDTIELLRVEKFNKLLKKRKREEMKKKQEEYFKKQEKQNEYQIKQRQILIQRNKEMKKKEKFKRQVEMKLKEELKKQKEIKGQEELKRQEDLKKQEEMKRQVDIKRQEDEIEIDEDKKQKEIIHDSSEKNSYYYECYIDGKTFATEKGYLKHFKKKHQNDYPFYCDKCNFGFYSYDEISKHEAKEHSKY
jgi:hypothetical protein